MGQYISYDTDQFYIGSTATKIQRPLKHGYIPTHAFVIIQSTNGMYVRKNI